MQQFTIVRHKKLDVFHEFPEWNRSKISLDKTRLKCIKILKSSNEIFFVAKNVKVTFKRPKSFFTKQLFLTPQITFASLSNYGYRIPLHSKFNFWNKTSSSRKIFTLCSTQFHPTIWAGRECFSPIRTDAKWFPQNCGNLWIDKENEVPTCARTALVDFFFCSNWSCKMLSKMFCWNFEYGKEKVYSIGETAQITISSNFQPTLPDIFR